MLDQLQLTPSETKEFISDNDALLLDVRTHEEFAIVNLSHIGNHLHLPMDALSQNASEHSILSPQCQAEKQLKQSCRGQCLRACSSVYTWC